MEAKKDLPTAEREQTRLYRAYKSIPRKDHQQLKIRNEIIKACGINTSIFYFWLSGKTKVPFLAKPIISEILGKKQYELFTD